MSQISQIKKIYHAAIYVRLSKEDGAVASHEKTESNSIANQKSLIRDFLKNKNDIEVVQEYVDDGFSGSNFERPAFQMMLEDIKKGKIDCVVTKDLSRFGREYIDSGMYIERLFPAMGVRFIAINDGIDSGEAKSQSDEIIIPFKNLINDAYCRDISIKIRSHLEIKRKQGDVITAFVPYGYKKNDKDKHKLEIDVYAANVVKDIFRMKLHGKSQDAIACELNSSGILPPAEYKASTGSNYQTCFKTKEKSEWTSVMVRRILTNEVYIGNLVQGKQTTPNHKVKKTIIKEKCEWIRIEKNHEPVITDRDFEVVQRLLAMDTRTSPEGHVSRIRGEEIEQAVLDVARKMAVVRLEEFEIQMNKDSSSDDIGQEIESLKKAKAHYAKLKFEIYDDYTRTNITREQMAKKTAEVKNKIAELDKMIAEKQELFDLQKDLFVDAKQEQLTKLSKLDKFDEDVIRNIIDYVLIYDNEHIEIKWNFDDFHIE